MIEIRHLKKSFGKLTVLKDINAVINKGEIISIIGPSGTGKSTLLRCLNLLEHPDAGEIILGGENILSTRANVPAIRMKMGMVFQQFNLFPHLTVLENITVSPRKLLHQSKEEAEKNAMSLLAKVGLESKAYALPTELSGGQQQRVAIARTLAMNPEVILFDEPTSALDPTMVDEVLNVITELAKTGITMLIVTHEMRFARSISTRIFYMDEGTIYEDGTPEQIFDFPKRIKTATFVLRVDLQRILVNRNAFDEDKMKTHVAKLMERYDLSMVLCEQLYSTMLLVLKEIIFPLSETAEVRLGAIADTKNISFGVIWNGPMENPLDNVSDSIREKLSVCTKIDFAKDETGQPRLRFMFQKSSVSGNEM